MNGLANARYHNSLHSTGTSSVYKPSSSIQTEPLTDKYTVGENIGRGKFAVVKKCTNKETNEVVAAKFIKKRRRGKSCREEILREVVMLEMALDHPRLVNLKEVYETTSELILITEYCAGGELFTECIVEEKFNEGDVRILMSQILEGLVYLHEKKIVHLDLKPQNILLTSEYPAGSIKICDLGFACLVNTGEDIRDIIGTPDYVAPEVLNYDPLGLYTDMWSVGVLAYVMLTTCSPFAAEDKQMTFCNITTVNLDFPDDLFANISGAAQDFIKKLLIADPSERLTAKECLVHEWISGASTPGRSLTSEQTPGADQSVAEAVSDARSSNAFDECKSVTKVQDQHSDMMIGETKEEKETFGDMENSVRCSVDSGEAHGDTGRLDEVHDDVKDSKRDIGTTLATARIGDTLVGDTASPDTESSMCISDPRSDVDSGMASGVASRDEKSESAQSVSGRSSTDLELTSDRESDGALYETASETEMVHKTTVEVKTKEEHDAESKPVEENAEVESRGMDEAVYNCNINHNAHMDYSDEMEHSDSVFEDSSRLGNAEVHEEFEVEQTSVVKVVIEKPISEVEDQEMSSPFPPELDVNIPSKISFFQSVDQTSPSSPTVMRRGRHSYGETSKRDNQSNPYDLASRGRNSVGGIDENIHTMQIGEKHKRVISDGVLSPGNENSENTGDSEYEYISVSKRVKSYEALSPVAKTPPYSPKIPRSPRIGRSLKGHFHH